MSSNEKVPEKFECFAIVEIMGHVTVAGHVTEETRFGAVMMRVDVPEVTKIQEWIDYDAPRDSITHAREVKRNEITIPAHTRYFGGGAIYSFTPCSEEVARKAAEKFETRPPGVLELKRALPSPPAATEEETHRDDPDGGEGVYSRRTVSDEAPF